MQNDGMLKPVLASSLVTGFGLAGGLSAGFLVASRVFEALNLHMTGFLSGLLGFTVLLIGLAGGGALWGYGLVKIHSAGEPQTVARQAAIAFGSITILVGIALELIFGLLSSLGPYWRLPIHHAFTLVFVPSAGFIAAFLSQRLTLWGNFPALSRRSIILIGLIASASFLLVNLTMLQLGWKIGAPGAAERMTMITVMLLSNLGAALAGGAALGFYLHSASKD